MSAQAEEAVETDAPCSPHCPICTDTSPPERWNGPYNAFRWSPNAPSGIKKLEVR